ncbi:MAG TPA: hypothetical protein VFD49_10410 [Candidatus Dormibacteraeota bacterium]|nr:hypothetical protein [Candidatus Dormibacteraeota bacterium]
MSSTGTARRPRGIGYEVDLEPVQRALARWRLTSARRRAPVQDLAAESGLSRCTVWRFLSGRRVGLDAAGRIARVLGLDLRQVLRPVGAGPTAPERALVEAARAVVAAHRRAPTGPSAELDARIDELAALLAAGRGGLPARRLRRRRARRWRRSRSGPRARTAP